MARSARRTVRRASCRCPDCAEPLLVAGIPGYGRRGQFSKSTGTFGNSAPRRIFGQQNRHRRSTTQFIPRCTTQITFFPPKRYFSAQRHTTTISLQSSEITSFVLLRRSHNENHTQDRAGNQYFGTESAIKEGRGLRSSARTTKSRLRLDTGETITPVCGYVGKHSARFVFKDCLREMWQMNKDMTNKGGYFRSEARRHVLEDILPHLPAELREAITPRHLCEEIDGETYEYFDSLWLPSATDVFGNDPDGWWKEETDSFQLPIFKEERDRVKEVPGNGTYPYWLRSRAASGSTVSCMWVLAARSAPATRSTRLLAPGFDL